MKLQIHGDKILVTKAIKEYLEEKVKKINRYFDNSEELKATVNIRVKNNLQTIEITIPTKHFTIRAEEDNENLYASIDLVLDKIERQITKNKDKMNKKYKNNDDFEMNFEGLDEIEEEKLDIIKRKTLSMKPMDEEEALLQMQLVNHDFFVFKNTDEECVSVLYKRKDNGYGIIDVK